MIGKCLRLSACVQSVINYMIANSDFTKIYLLPFLLAIVDLLYRKALSLDLTDVGADIAFLGVGAMASVLSEETGGVPTYVKVACFICILVSWMLSLSFLKVGWGIGILWKCFFSWTMGFFTVILSGITVKKITGG